MNPINLEILKVKSQLKDLKKLKKTERKLRVLESKAFKRHPYYIFIEVIETFLDLIRNPVKR